MTQLQKYSLSVRLIALLALLLGGTSPLLAQVGRPPAAGGTEQVEILNADSLEVLQTPGNVTRRLVNNVRLRHKGALMYCNLAIQNATSNVIEAYGNVRILQGDTITVRGDTMYYYGNTRSSTLLGRVSLKDRKMTLTTARLDYDLANGIAHYPVKGRIVDKENILTSDEGYYDTRLKQFTFIRNVRLVSPKSLLTADSLLYNSFTKVATFQGPTRIVNEDGTLLARNGTYNTVTRVSNFRQRATAYTDKYTLTGDTLNFDNQTELGIARGNVVLVGKENNTVITGDHGRYNGKAGVSRVTGHAVVRSVVSKDTLYMRADTLFSYDTPSGSKEKRPRKLIGQKNVLVYKSDLQSRCDSLVYSVSDSTFYFYKKPIVWSQSYQMEADTLTAKLKNNRINTMLLRGKSFVVSQDTLKYFNQIKGRSITATFRDVRDTLRPPVAKRVVKAGSRTAARTASAPKPPRSTTAVAGPPKVEEKTVLDRVVVEGNGQSIYFVIDDKNVFTGMNRVDCSKMTIDFKKNRVGTIRFYGQPDGTLIPPKQLTEDKKKLDGFRWREKDKPTKEQVLGQPEPKPKPAAQTTAGPINVPTNVPASINAAALQKEVNTTGLPVNRNGIKIDALNKPFTPKPGQKQ
ncbi:OstA-like protein [Fibrella sp. WM1]|uniref:OstA-like protein n=1 Tax=Fibrella musci TaxID=3242485 RepID=UPI00352188B0